MVQCSIASCKNHSRQNYKGPRMVFFTVHKVPNLNLRRNKDGAHKQKKNIILKCQNEAWMSAINRG